MPGKFVAFGLALGYFIPVLGHFTWPPRPYDNVSGNDVGCYEAAISLGAFVRAEFQRQICWKCLAPIRILGDRHSIDDTEHALCNEECRITLQGTRW